MGVKISVVTVCFNAEKSIENTIKSVLVQTYRPLEYIIIDGESKDETYAIVQKYADKMQNMGIEYRTISEKDTGIYNAMNKGIAYSTGEWIAFMNADDLYYSASCIDNLMDYAADDTVAIFGNEVVIQNGKKRVNKHSDFAKIMPKRLGFCHQAAFVRTGYMKKYRFDESYRITADYNFFLSLFLRGEKFQYADIDVAEYSSCGISAIYYKKSINETFRVKAENGVINPKNPIEQAKRIYWIIKTSLQKG